MQEEGGKVEVDEEREKNGGQVAESEAKTN